MDRLGVCSPAMRPYLLAFALLLSLPAFAADHTYVAGTILSIRPSDDGSFQGYGIMVDNILYGATCEEKPFHSCDTDFLINAPVRVRVEGNYLYVVRKNGKELRLHIGQRRLLGPAIQPSVN